jgi:hypothetical protein
LSVKTREKAFFSLKGLLDGDLSFHRRLINKMMIVTEEAIFALKLKNPGY